MTLIDGKKFCDVTTSEFDGFRWLREASAAPPFPKNPTMSTLTDVADVDAWITTLSDCKQLPESDIERLCEKVSIESWSPHDLALLLAVFSFYFALSALRT